MEISLSQLIAEKSIASLDAALLIAVTGIATYIILARLMKR